MVVLVSGMTIWYYLASTAPLIVAYREHNLPSLTTLSVTLPLLFITIGALSALSNRLIRSTLDDLRRRNSDLETAYARLAAQTQQEHALGQHIGHLASELSEVSANQATGVAFQASSIEEVVAAVSELHDTADQIAARAADVLDAADLALRNVQLSQALVMRSVEAVIRNREQVQQTITYMQRVSGAASAITAFINSISGLAEETHLLALNATIEAAGAGTMGRRFSVVASEVQGLARRSNEIVEQIRLRIEELNEANRVTVNTTRGSITVANEVEGFANEMRSAQEHVVRAVEQTNILVHQISAATTQQTAATAQVTNTMARIQDIAAETHQHTSALERTVEDLLRTAGNLESAMLHMAKVTTAPAVV